MSEMKETDFPPPEPQPFVTEEGREIERLRAELAAAKADLAAAIKQRDEAQQDICYDEFVRRYETGHEINTPEGIAAERGWDCYSAKEGGGA